MPRTAAFAIILLAVAAAPVRPASFDCGQARTTIEKTICSTPALSELDEKVADAYRSALTKDINPEKIRAEQRTWLKDERNRCQTVDCLTAAHQKRLATLAYALPTQSPPSNAAPAPAPAPAAPVTGTQINPISECDTLASHPDDPEAFAKGVGDAQINGPAVIRACEAAVVAEPHTPRLHFQLARGYLAAGRVEEAAERLLTAAQDGHGGALAHLADIHIDGLLSIESDPLLARRLYEKALASGFEPARKPLLEFEDYTDSFTKAENEEQISMSANKSETSTSKGTAKAYKNADIIANISRGKLDNILHDETWVKEYLYNMAENIGAVCEAHFSKAMLASLRDATNVPQFRQSMGQMAQTLGDAIGALGRVTINDVIAAQQNATPEKPKVDWTQVAFEEALNDTGIFLTEHGCKGRGIEEFNKNLSEYINDTTRNDPPGALFNVCANEGKSLRFCRCFADAIDSVPVSRVDRKGLLGGKFTVTSEKLMKENKEKFSPC